MKEVIRTRKQIEKLAKKIGEELEDRRIIYGREEMSEYIDHLLHFLNTGEIIDEWNEAGYWLTNEKSYFGKDYGVE